MQLEWLELRDVRSYRHLAFHPGPGVNVLVGDNGSGKTSVLEAIGYLAALASFRRAPDAALIRSGADGAILRGEIGDGSSAATIEVEVPSSGRRRVLVNGKRATGRAAVADHVTLVSFLPDDLDLVKRGPVYRRDYVDDLAAQVWPVAATEQQEYERALRQRNGLLRREGRHADRTTLDVLDEKVADLGGAVIARRLDTIEAVSPVVSSLYRELGERAETVTWTYAGTGVSAEPPRAREALAQQLASALGAARETDVERRVTTVGPQRDDVILTVAERDARTRASQGEQRSLALGLRLAALHILTERRVSPPILLLDDVFSELDAGRGERLMSRLPAGQVFVTTARADEVPLAGQRWRVAEGSVTPHG